MEQWTSKANILKDLVEITQGDVPEELVTVTKHKPRLRIEKDANDDPDLQMSMNGLENTPNLKGIPEMLRMIAELQQEDEEYSVTNELGIQIVTETDSENIPKPKEVNEQHGKKIKVQTKTKKEKYVEKDAVAISSSSIESNENSIFDTTVKREENKQLIQKETAICSNPVTTVSPNSNVIILANPASMFKKKVHPKTSPIKTVEQITVTEPVYNQQYELSDCAQELYEEFKKKEERAESIQETTWTNLYEVLKKRDEKIRLELNKKKLLHDGKNNK